MSHRRLLLLLLLGAGLLRAAWSVSVSPARFLEIDGRDYRDIAWNLASGRGYCVSAPRWFEPAALIPPGPHRDFARPPLLPVLGATLFRLPGPWEVWARLLMVLLGTSAVWLAYRAGAACFDRRTVLLAAAILALQPYTVFYSGRWSTEMPCLALILGAVTALAAAHRREGDSAPGTGPAMRASAPWALAGLLTALAVLARPVSLILVPVFAVWILRRRRPGLLRLSRAVLFVAAAALPLLPWALRNHAAAGSFTPGTFFGPYNLWLALNDRAVSMYRAAGTPQFYAELEGLNRDDSKAMVRRMEAGGIVGPVAEARYWSQSVREWLRAHPRQAAELILRHAVHFFRVTPEQTLISRAVWAASLYLWPVHLLALLALWWHRRGLPWLLLLPPLAGLAAGLPFVSILRYRFPFLDPYAVILAAAAAAELPGRLRRR